MLDLIILIFHVHKCFSFLGIDNHGSRREGLEVFVRLLGHLITSPIPGLSYTLPFCHITVHHLFLCLISFLTQIAALDHSLKLVINNAPWNECLLQSSKEKVSAVVSLLGDTHVGKSTVLQHLLGDNSIHG